MSARPVTWDLARRGPPSFFVPLGSWHVKSPNLWLINCPYHLCSAGRRQRPARECFMKRMIGTRNLLLVLLLVAIPAASFAGLAFSITIAPPPLPVYVQPPCPGDGYLWTPGYWAWGPAGYYWVPGTWIAPPSVGVYWTPGYWGYNNGYYGWNTGY